MQLVTIPATAAQLDAVRSVHVDHSRLGLTEGLDAGQLLVLRDLDGALRWAAVDRLVFTATTTTYHLQLGYPTDETSVRQHVDRTDVPAPRHATSTADVVEALGQLAAALSLAGAVGRAVGGV